MKNLRLMNFRMSVLKRFYLLYANQSNLCCQSKLLSVAAALLLTFFPMSPSFIISASFVNSVTFSFLNCDRISNGQQA